MFVELLDVAFILFGDNSVLRIIRLRAAHKGLDAEKGGSDAQSRRPFVLKDVQADNSGNGTNVWMPDLGVEFHFWWLVWILVWNHNVNLELSSFIW